MSRRLVNRAGSTVARSSAPVSSSSTTTLPDYEPPSCPLNEHARRALGDLTKDRGTATYQTQLKESLRLLGASVYDLHERLREQSERLEALRSKREEKGTDKTEEEERLEAHVQELETSVNGLTEKSESAVRDLIDKKAELEDESVVLHDLYTQAVTQHASALPPRRTRGSGQDVDETNVDEDSVNEPPPPNSTLQAFESRRNDKLSDYTSMSTHERYGLNNDYAAFKKLWHDAKVGPDGVPLPDASRWFNADGQPNMGGTEGDGDFDDEIAVAREVISINCPLTLMPMEEPYTNRKCKHTFEKSSLLNYLPIRGGNKQCPQTGCSNVRAIPVIVLANKWNAF